MGKKRFRLPKINAFYLMVAAMVVVYFLNAKLRYKGYTLAAWMLVPIVFLIFQLVRNFLRRFTTISLFRDSHHRAFFTRRKLVHNSNEGKIQKFRAIGSFATLDLTKVDLSRGDVKIVLLSYFSELIVSVSPQTPAQVSVITKSGIVELPNEKKVTSGDYTFQSALLEDGRNMIRIQANVKHGSIRFFFTK